MKQYLVLYLHEAVITSIFSRWTDFEDDARSLVALEVAHRARNALAHGLIEVTELAMDFDHLSGEAIEKLSPPSKKVDWKRPKIRPELVNYIYVRILQDLFQESNQDVYLSKLERLRAGFGLNQHELARLLDVTAESIRKWVRGGGISPDVRGVIDLNVALLNQLETYVRPGLLPAVLRRPARGLDGRRPLELLFSREGESIVQYLENLTTYATTA
ncbi:MAG: hypothetical protein ACT4PY_16920 [Armatimonadota bacterium]